MSLLHDHADVSVRPAIPGDEIAMTSVQLRAWRTGIGALVPGLVERLDVPAMTAQWAAAIIAPPTPGHRVLVALAGARIVGLAAVVPVAEGVEVAALEVEPEHRRGGHGSRLLAACVDLGRQDGAAHVLTWVLAEDEVRATFLGSAGLGRDGATRLIVEGGGGQPELAEQRWFAEI